MGDICPIALCNVSYKIISRVLANKLQGVLQMLISKNQSAFILGRLISDNIMIAYELMHFLKRKSSGKSGWMAIKLDMNKVFDRIEWSFLETILRNMGFDSHWVQLVMACVLYASFSIIVWSCHSLGPFLHGCGIRQGDPLSPFLFILCAEGFSALLSKYVAQGRLKGIQVARTAPIITHLLFANDSYVYCNASLDSASAIMDLLKTF